MNALRSTLNDPNAAANPAWAKVGDAAATVGSARAAVDTIRSANQEVHELAPKLLSELGDFASAVGVQKLDGMSRYLERFELTVQRVAAGDERPGLRGQRRGAGRAASRGQPGILEPGDARPRRARSRAWPCRRVTGAEAEQRLKIVVQRNQQFAAAVRKAIGAAEPLSKAQAAARTLPALAGGLATEARRGGAGARPRAARCKPWILVLLAAAHGPAGGARLGVCQVDERPAQHRAARPRERAQSGGHHAPAG